VLVGRRTNRCLPFHRGAGFPAFLFAVATLLLGVPDGIIETLVVLWLFVYLFLAMRRVYGQSKRKTFLKYSLLGFSYFVVAVFVGIGTALVTALFV
jgi:cell division protein FtsW (lipid II flippase)